LLSQGSHNGHQYECQFWWLYLCSIAKHGYDGVNEDNNEYGDLDISGDLTIIGTGTGTSIYANSIDRVVDVHGDISVTIEGLSIIGGHSPDGNAGVADGGGIRSSATLYLLGVTVDSNRSGNGDPGGYGGGILSSGSLIVEDSLITANLAGDGINGVTTGAEGGRGGGIGNTAGDLSIKDSTISGNTAGAGQIDVAGGDGGAGGGIYFWGSTGTIISSAIIQNKAGVSETHYGGSGGGIFTYYPISIENTTISGNWSGDSNPTSGVPGYGGGILATQGATILYSTIYDNHTGLGAPFNSTYGGGIYCASGDTLTLGASIVAGNTVQLGYSPDIFSPANVISEDFNLIGDISGFTMSGPTGNSHLGVAGFTLPALVNVGGPTQIHPLTVDNQAVDWIPAGTYNCGSLLTTDQRGKWRPVDGDRDGITACDIGAFELQQTSSLPLIIKSP
jgi:hypothetical protein